MRDMKFDLIRNLEEGDIEIALKEIDSIPTRDGLEDLLADIEEISHDNAVPLILFAKAHAHERLESYEIAYNFAIRAGQLGLAAGFYRAGRILDEHGSSLNLDRPVAKDARALFAKGADLGHVWCKIEVF